MTNKRLFRLRRALLAALLEYSKNIGLAFQIRDDILDVTGTDGNMGKTLGKDKESVEWRNLTEWGMIEPLAGYQGAVCRLTAATRRTMEETGNAPRDSRLYGFEVQ